MMPAANSANSNGAAGSPQTGEPLFLVVGKIHHPHGLKGDVIMEVITDFPERLRAGVVVYVGDQHIPLTIHSRRKYGTDLLLNFAEYKNPESAAELTNKLVFVRADDRPPLADGEYYQHQLLGLQVVSEEGQVLGNLVQILETGANDVYIVQPETGSEVLLPAIPDVIKGVELENKRIIIHLLPGLLNE